MRADMFGLALLVAAGLPWGCSSEPRSPRRAASDQRQSSVEPDARLMTYSAGFPPPAGRAYGVFGLRNRCLALKPETTGRWRVAVVPPGSSFTRGADNVPNGVVIDGTATRFGERVDFGGGVGRYNLGKQGGACPGPTVIVGTILKRESARSFPKRAS